MTSLVSSQGITMKKFTDKDFQTRLGNTIATLEQASQIEVVVLIKNKSANYEDVPLGLGAVFMMLAFSYFFLADVEFESYLIYFYTLFSFALGVLIGLIPMMQRLFTGKKRKTRNIEIMARALFQKGGLHHTSTKIGTLLYFSLLEQMIYIVADRGAELAIPAEEWQKLNQNLQAVFKAKNPSETLITELENCKELFNRYIPALETNVNELPDDLQVDL